MASGYSLQYGASHPHVLVGRAVEHEMDTLALTDRDGAYGAVRFAKACVQGGVRPVLGVDLGVAPVIGGPQPDGSPDPRRPVSRTPVRGGAFRTVGPPRVTFLAGSRRGWAALCRLVSATHLAGERGQPRSSLELVAEHVAGQDVLVLLGPGSELGWAVTQRREDLARATLAPWLEVVDRSELVVELVSHRLPGAGPGSSPHAARMAGLARSAGLGVVLTNAVRYADRADAPTVDVLDAARRLVPLDLRHVDRGNAEGFLKSGKQMAEVAEEICRFAGLGSDTVREAHHLLARTRAVADRCALDPHSDLGLGQVHLPELGLSLGAAGGAGGPVSPDGVLRARCEAGVARRYGGAPRQRIWKRLDDELQVISGLGYASYFLTVADVTDLIRERGVRYAARGSGAGSLVTYLLGVSGVDPLRHDLLMERFLSPLRRALPDIDVDVESARRLEVYEAVLDRYGGQRCVCVSMMDTYRVRHAVRDVGAALGMPVGEIDAIAKAFPHIRARDARVALRDLPELRASGLGEQRLDLLFRLVERLDGLPRHIAMHPCGVLLSDATLLDRTPVEASYAGFPMSQFDKDDVEDLGLLKLDVLGIRMQSSMAHAVDEIERLEGVRIDLDDEQQVPFDDEATFTMISAAKTLGCFQIESPGQRELVGKSGHRLLRGHHHRHLAVPSGAGQERHDHPLPRGQAGLADAALSAPRPAPDPARHARRGGLPRTGHRDDRAVRRLRLRRGRRGPAGARRRRGDGRDQAVVLPAVDGAGISPSGRGGDLEDPRVVRVVRFLQGPRRGLRATDVPVRVAQGALPGPLPVRRPDLRPGDVPQAADPRRRPPARHRRPRAGRERSEKAYVTERVGRYDEPPPRVLGQVPRHAPDPGLPDGRDYGIRLALSEVKGISEAEVDRIVAGRPYQSLTDFWHRAHVSRPVLERLVLAGGFDAVYGIGSTVAVRRRRHGHPA